MRGCTYAPEAKDDLAQIWAWIAERSGVRVADGLKRKLEDKLAAIVAKHPGAGRMRAEFGPDIRSFPVPPYMVFYRCAGRSVQILRIRHGHQDIREPLMSLLAAV